VILVDTGPLVGLFDPLDSAHERCRGALRQLREPILTTVAVLTEAFHLLGPGSRGSRALSAFVTHGGVTPYFLDSAALARAFELMERYADLPMDLADASLVVAAERSGARRVLTLDRRDFAAYRIRRGHRQLTFQIVSC
jgi:uncharacterized protein